MTQDHKFRIAMTVALKRYFPLVRDFREDVRQECHILALSIVSVEAREVFRAADNHFYRMALNYGFKKFNIPGGFKTPLIRDTDSAHGGWPLPQKTGRKTSVRKKKLK